MCTCPCPLYACVCAKVQCDDASRMPRKIQVDRTKYKFSQCVQCVHIGRVPRYAVRFVGKFICFKIFTRTHAIAPAEVGPYTSCSCYKRRRQRPRRRLRRTAHTLIFGHIQFALRYKPKQMKSTQRTRKKKQHKHQTRHGGEIDFGSNDCL